MAIELGFFVFVSLFGFFLLIMITLWAKTINACQVAGFPSTLCPSLRLRLPIRYGKCIKSSEQAIVIVK